MKSMLLKIVYFSAYVFGRSFGILQFLAYICVIGSVMGYILADDWLYFWTDTDKFQPVDQFILMVASFALLRVCVLDEEKEDKKDD